MIALASHADQYWSCYPSIARICELSRYKDRAVRNAIKHLKERGVLMVKTGGGRGGASFYTIIPSALNPAADAPIKAKKPRIRNTVSEAETPHLIPETPHLIPLNSAPDAPEPIKEPRQEPKTACARESDVVVVPAAPTRREEILTLIGCSTTGIKPNGRFTGTTNDVQEIPMWDALGLTKAEQDAKICEMLDKKRQTEPGWMPTTWKWFTPGMAELARAKQGGPPLVQSVTATETPEQRRARYRRIIGA